MGSTTSARHDSMCPIEIPKPCAGEIRRASRHAIIFIAGLSLTQGPTTCYSLFLWPSSDGVSLSESCDWLFHRKRNHTVRGAKSSQTTHPFPLPGVMARSNVASHVLINNTNTFLKIIVHSTEFTAEARL